MEKILWVFALFLCFQAEASTYNPGPPPLFDNFKNSDEIFEGKVLSIEESSGGRGDSVASIEVIESLKSARKPGEVIRLGFNGSCPFLVRRSDCKRHTTPLKAGDLYVIFAKNGFTSRSYGTLPKADIWPAILALKAGLPYFQANLLRGHFYATRIQLFGEVIESFPALHSSEELVLRVKVIDSFSEALQKGQQIEVRMWRRPIELRKKLSFILYRDEDEFRLEGDPQSMEDFKKRADWLEKEYKNHFIFRDRFRDRNPKLTSLKAGGYIPGPKRHIDAFLSLFKFLGPFEFDVGYRWNPDDGDYFNH